jgi:hypothetical protein
MLFNVWVTLLTPLSINNLVGGLVRKGYTVGPTGDPLYDENHVSTLLGLVVEDDENEEDSDAEDAALDQLQSDLEDVLKDTSTKYHSYVITPDNAARSSSGNIQLPGPKITKTVFDHLGED